MRISGIDVGAGVLVSCSWLLVLSNGVADEGQNLGTVGPGGGHVTGDGGSIEAQLSTGDFISGGSVANVGADLLDLGGYTGQLFDPKSLEIEVSPSPLGEEATGSLSAVAVLDDDTSVVLSASELDWVVLTGPIANIGLSGLATADVVYEDTTAGVQGSWCSIDGSLTFTVVDTNKDNFGSYAGDQIDDDWQFSFFGLGNPDAGPGVDPDGDRQSNLFEFTALVDPTDPQSFFRRRIEKTPGQPSHYDIIFSPVWPSRTYELESSTDLNSANFAEVSGTTFNDSGNERTITTPFTPEPRRFYRVKISQP